jgi:hypothetical protein
MGVKEIGAEFSMIKGLTGAIRIKPYFCTI